jgi:hypothetical protein
LDGTFKMLATMLRKPPVLDHVLARTPSRAPRCKLDGDGRVNSRLQE